MYKTILLAAASLEHIEFSAADLRKELHQQTGNNISQQSLNNYFKKLVSSDHSSILHRTAKGVYRFSDPRMPSYVKIACEKL
jgi:hypothetical protein